MNESKTLPYFDEKIQPGVSADLLRYILMHTKDEGTSVRFECPLGMSQVYMQRVRMRITRLRGKLATEGRLIARFRLNTQVEVAPIRKRDIVTVTRQVNASHKLEEMLEKIQQEKELTDGFIE